MSEIMTTQEIAVYLKVHEVTVCKHAEEGAIPAKRIGRRWRFDKKAIDEWIAKGKNIPVAGKAKAAKRKASKG